MDEPDTELSRLEHIVDGLEKPRRLEFTVLRAITDKFSNARRIGNGGCGVVYKGVLRNGTVAVKRLFNSHTIDEKMFHREVKSMMMVKHKNIVRLLGYCSDTQEEAIEIGGKYVMGEVRERLLCFEYINNGSLQNHIKDEFRGLKWHERYQIIEGICEGLHHLHKEKKIRHMDLKPDNILLGDHMVPKITDFGVARLDEKSQTTNAQRLLSLGYCAPEYRDHGEMSAKSDIYSLGVIILELVTGSKMDPNITKVLRRWRHRWNKSSEHTPLLWYRQVTKCLDLAQWCRRENPIGRPDIGDIIRELNEIDRWNGQTSYTTISTFDEIMSSLEDMLGIEPLDMHIPFVLNEYISFSIMVTNDTDDYFAFRIATTSLLPFSTQPEKGIVLPRSELCATIILTEQDKALQQNQCHKFSVQSSRIYGIPMSMDITRDMLDDKVGKVVDEVNLTVVFDMPPIPEQPQTDIDSIPCQEADKASCETHLTADRESLGPSSQVYQGSEEFMAPTVPDDPRYKDVHVLERILDGSESPGKLKFSILEFITENFSESRIIGGGGTATVYKGILRNGIVAVRKFHRDDQMFYQEVNTMMSVKHQNIVRFLGYCSHAEEVVIETELGRIILAEKRVRLLCFEYASNGDLGNRLTDELRGLEWHTRYQIIEGICEAFNYLHRDKDIIHMGLQPSKILLDDKMMPKVSVFSMSRLDDKSQTTSSKRFLSLGYRAPEYLSSGKQSAKSGIYSLGVVIRELMIGTKMVAKTTDVLRRWRHRWNKSGNYMPLWAQQLTKCLELAQSCTRDNPIERPYIGDIIRELHESNQVSLCLDNLDDMLGIEPLELHFPFEFNKQLSQTVQLNNDTDHSIAFRMITTWLLPFRTEPNKEVVPPRSSCVVTVTMFVQNEIPDHYRHLSEILVVESTRVEEGVTAKDITQDMFNKKNVKVVDTVQLTVMFDTPTLPEEA